MTCQWSWMQFIWVILPLTFAILVWIQLSKKKETFLSTDDTQILIQTYSKVLNRNPTATELAKHIKEIDRKEYTIHELEIRLYNSDEYKRLIKTQKNGLSPELSRMVEEKELIQYIRELYTKEQQKKPITDVLLPLKDLFVYLDYNPYKFVAMLRNSKYPDFETEFLANKKLSKDTLLDIYKRTFNELKISADADAIRKTETITPLGKKYKSFPKSSGSENTNLFGITDTDGSNLVSFLLEKGFSRIQKQMMTDANGTMVNQDGSKNNYKSDNNTSTNPDTTRFYLTPGKPPICVPVGEKHSVSPVVFGDLLGTTLAEAKDTQIGSIMPKFEYKEYIDVPNSCPTGSKIKATPQKITPKPSDITPQSSYSVATTPSSRSSTITSSTQPYSQGIEKYNSILKPALDAFAKWKNEMNTTAFYTELSSNTDAKAFFKKYPYMVDILALYTYEKSAERAALNQIGVMEFHKDIGYYTKPEYRYGSDNVHISAFLSMASLNQFYTNNRATIDTCLKDNSCLTISSNTTPKQYSPEVQKYKTMLEAAYKAAQDNQKTMATMAFSEEVHSNKNPYVIFKKYPFMIDIMKYHIYLKANPKIITYSISETELDELENDIGFWTGKYGVGPGADGLSVHLPVIVSAYSNFYLNNRDVINDCITQNTCLTSTSTTVEGFTNGTLYNYYTFN
uniref:Uncharacterized protein n=1 Tax=viral metagenome TaxID=1070528 RepID=A0A6C0CQD1_9ZZZZ